MSSNERALTATKLVLQRDYDNEPDIEILQGKRTPSLQEIEILYEDEVAESNHHFGVTIPGMTGVRF